MNKTVNIARGLAIIGMVIGHAVDHSYLTVFIYKWHMPLFFFFSGFFFDVNRYSFKGFVWKRIKSLYVPFLFWTLLMICFHNVLVSNGICAGTFYDYDKLKVLVYRAVFEMRQYEPLLGTFWFFPQLLAVNILGYVYFSLQKNRSVLSYVMMPLCLLLGALMKKYNIGIFYQFNDITCMGLFFFICGKVLRSQEFLRGVKQCVASIVIILLSGWSFKEMIALSYGNVVSYAIVAVFGIVLIYNISISIGETKVLADVLAYAGKNSLSIMILHFTCFKIVSLMMIKCDNFPIGCLASHPVIHNASYFWQVAYVLIGVFVPLGLNGAYLKLKKCWKNEC